MQNIYMAQYEKRLKRKMQSIVFEANRRGILNEVFLGQCERKRKRTEEKLGDLRAKLALLLQKLQLVSDRARGRNRLRGRACGWISLPTVGRAYPPWVNCQTQALMLIRILKSFGFRSGLERECDRLLGTDRQQTK